MNASIRILVVEDEAILAEDLRETLERQSYRVLDIADNADDACALVRALQPDLVMMDNRVGGGIQCAESLINYTE